MRVSATYAGNASVRLKKESGLIIGSVLRYFGAVDRLFGIVRNVNVDFANENTATSREAWEHA